MHVENPVRISPHEIPAEDFQEAGQHDNVNSLFFQQLNQAGFEVFLWQEHVSNSGLLRPLQSTGFAAVRYHQGQIPVGEIACLPPIDDGLQVGSPTGNQYSNSCLLLIQ